MKRILCYGDSNTWGYDPVTQTRFDDQTRWTRVLAATLGTGYEIIEEGLNGRTTVWDDPIEGELASDKNGRTYLGPCLQSHAPLDGVILMLGTNDLKRRFGLPASDIALGVKALVGVIQRSRSGRGNVAPPVLLLAPPPLAALSEGMALAEMFEGGEAKSVRFGELHARVAAEASCAFFDAGTVIRSSPVDGIHFDAEEHATLGAAVAGQTRTWLPLTPGHRPRPTRSGLQSSKTQDTPSCE
jgi:lysophospholipase L1-like esterase